MLDYKLIGQRIKEKRKEAGLTQEQLAERLGISQVYASQIERGVEEPNLQMLEQICITLDCPLEYLIAGVIKGQKDYRECEIESLIEKTPEDIRNKIVDIIKILNS